MSLKSRIQVTNHKSHPLCSVELLEHHSKTLEGLKKY